jgi:hypothetical protein
MIAAMESCICHIRGAVIFFLEKRVAATFLVILQPASCHQTGRKVMKHREHSHPLRFRIFGRFTNMAPLLSRRMQKYKASDYQSNYGFNKQNFFFNFFQSSSSSTKNKSFPNSIRTQGTKYTTPFLTTTLTHLAFITRSFNNRFSQISISAITILRSLESALPTLLGIKDNWWGRQGGGRLSALEATVKIRFLRASYACI